MAFSVICFLRLATVAIAMAMRSTVVNVSSSRTSVCIISRKRTPPTFRPRKMELPAAIPQAEMIADGALRGFQRQCGARRVGRRGRSHAAAGGQLERREICHLKQRHSVSGRPAIAQPRPRPADHPPPRPTLRRWHDSFDSDIMP